MHKKPSFISSLLCVWLAACSGSQRSKDWDIDYSSVYRAYEGKQYDNSYKAPTVIGCIDDDLYNCK